MNPLNAQVPTDREWIEESLPGQASSAGDSLDIFLKVCDQACYTHPQWVVEWFTGLNKSGTVSSGTELGFMGAICSARAYTVMRKPDSAGVWIQSVLKAGPRSAGVYYWQACVETATRFLSERNTKEASLWAGKVLSSPLSGPEEKAEAYLVLASVLGFNGDYPGALETAGKGLGLIGNDMSGRLKARLLIFKGLTEIKTGKLAIALRHLLEARQAVLSLHDNALLFEIHSAIGTIFWQAGEHKNASSLFERSLGYYNQIAYPPPGIGDLYNNLGIVNLMLERYQDAESYFLQAIHHHKAEGSHHRIAAALNNMAELRIATGEHREADEYIQTALGMARQNKDTSMLASMLHTLAKVNKAKGDYQEASRVLKEAQSYAMTRKLGWVLSAIYEEQYLVAELSGDYRSAFESLKLYQAARDSVLDARLRLQVVETKMEINRDSGNSAAVAPQNSGMPVHEQNQNPFTRYLLAILTLVSGIMLISLIYAVYFHSRRKEIQKQLENARQRFHQLRDEHAAAIEKANESEKVMENFLYTMTHELRTPLNGIIGFSEILSEELDSFDQKSMARAIYQSGERLLNTVNSILELSDIEATRTEINLTDFPIEGLLERIVEEFRATAEAKGLALRFTPSDTPCRTRSDESHVEKIFSQLIDNAVKYTFSGSVEITTNLTTRGKKSWVVVKVADTGVGIKEDQLGLIFANFRQVSEGFNRKHEGSGVGLSLTRNLVNLLGGYIEVESEPDKGSVFSVYLPAIGQGTGISGLTSPFLQNRGNEKKPSLLLVEDEETNREFVIYTLHTYFDIDLALDGKTALNLAFRKQYDLILMDINLGQDISGIEVVRQLRNSEAYRDTPIAAVTANARKAQRESLLGSGFTHYLAKPFTRAELKALIRNMSGGNPFTGQDAPVY